MCSAAGEHALAEGVPLTGKCYSSTKTILAETMEPEKTVSARAPRTLEEIRARLRAEMPHLKERFAVERLGIFGSWVRGEQTLDSDVDLLVTFTDMPGLFDYVALERRLSEILGVPVDVGMPGELKSSVRPQAEREAQWL